MLPRAFGLGRQSPRAWAIDWLKGTAAERASWASAGGRRLPVDRARHGLELVVGLRRCSPRWLGLVLVFVTPYVLVPLFFKMRPLADTATVERIHALVNRAGAPVRDVCSLDFSRRTAEANAAVIGLGRSRRVVIADTLLAEFSPGEVDAVVAHELGHHVHRDVQRLLLGNAVLIWLGLFAASRLSDAALPVLSLPSLAYVPGYPMLLFVVELFFLLVVAAAQLVVAPPGEPRRSLRPAADRRPGRVRRGHAPHRLPEPDRAAPAALVGGAAGDASRRCTGASSWPSPWSA